MVTNKKRWRLWACFEGPGSEKKGCDEIRVLLKKGFKAKRWATRPEHYTSGHFHVSVLCTFEELCKLGGFEIKKRGKLKRYQEELILTLLMLGGALTNELLKNQLAWVLWVFTAMSFALFLVEFIVYKKGWRLYRNGWRKKK